MARVGERVMAVITSQSVDSLGAAGTRTPGRVGTSSTPAGLLDDARFIARTLVAEGFELSNFHPLAISFAGSPAAFERVFAIRPVQRTFACGRGRQIDGYDVRPEDAERLSDLPALFEGRAGAMAIARPPRLIDDAGLPVRDLAAADLPVWSLPDEVAISIWADGTGAPTATGHGIVAAQIGTGHYRHRFFRDRGYRVLPTLLGPGQRHPQRDDHGHSTGEAACLFGAAPDLRLRPIKGLLDPVGDLLMAMESEPKPNLIINSWGYDVGPNGWNDLERADRNLYIYLKVLEAAISSAAAGGIALCASAASSWNSFPACHPEVIAIAAASKGRAVHKRRRDAGAGRLYPGRQVPDIWSDAAKSVRAGLDLIGCTYPVQPGSVLCRPGLQDAGGDEGFAWCDIEQAAAPLAAGKLALLLESHRGLSSSAFRAILTEAADGADPMEIEGKSPASETVTKRVLHGTASSLGSLAG
ncbi:MAG: hypothetical protein ACR2QJ_15890 [Geminicoccaceae bacterium]